MGMDPLSIAALASMAIGGIGTLTGASKNKPKEKELFLDPKAKQFRDSIYSDMLAGLQNPNAMNSGNDMMSALQGFMGMPNQTGGFQFGMNPAMMGGGGGMFNPAMMPAGAGGGMGGGGPFGPAPNPGVNRQAPPQRRPPRQGPPGGPGGPRV